MVRRGRPLGSGVEILKTCLRIRFIYQGRAYRETLQWKPTAETVKAAERLVAKIRREIDLDSFDYDRHFPNGAEAARMRFSRSAMTALRLCPKAAPSSARPASTCTWSRS